MNRITYLSRRGQEVILVIAALEEMGGEQSRQAVVDYIADKRWFEIIGEDLTPNANTKEAKYRVALAWARKDAVERQWIENLEKNSWSLNRAGRDQLDVFKRRFSKDWDVGQCEFFTQTFKLKLKPDFVPQPSDKKREPRPDYLAELSENLGW